MERPERLVLEIIGALFNRMAPGALGDRSYSPTITGNRIACAIPGPATQDPPVATQASHAA